MESWRTCWREGFAPNLSTEGLQALKAALQRDDKRLIQGQTVNPPPLQCMLDNPVEACCPISWTGWQGEGLHTVDEISRYFVNKCLEADRLLGEPVACRYFLNAWDESDREYISRELTEEINLELIRRMGP